VKLHWPTILLGIVGGVLISLLGLAAIIAVVIAFSAADSIAAVQALPRYGFAVSLMAALAAAWGAFLAIRRRPAHPSGHGVLSAWVSVLYTGWRSPPPSSAIYCW